MELEIVAAFLGRTPWDHADEEAFRELFREGASATCSYTSCDGSQFLCVALAKLPRFSEMYEDICRSAKEAYRWVGQAWTNRGD